MSLSNEDLGRCAKAVVKLEAVKKLVEDNPHDGEDLIPSGSSCRVVLNQPPPCTGSFEKVMQHVMCCCWYRIPKDAEGEHLVELFRRNLKECWAEFSLRCTKAEKR